MTNGLEVESWQGLLVHDVVSVCHPEPGMDEKLGHLWPIIIVRTDLNDLRKFNKPAPIFTALFI